MEHCENIKPTIVTSLEDGFDVGTSDGNTLTLFWAPWCHPCRLQKSIVDALATAFLGRVKFVEINTDKRPEVANLFGVQSIPTLILFKDRVEVKRFIGFQERTCLSKYLETIV